MPKGIYKKTKEHKKKLSLVHKGKKHSEETKRKIGESHRGKRLSEKTRNKLSEMKQGENNPSWKGGEFTKGLELKERIRHCFKYRQWRSDIFTRDNFICVKCEYRQGGILEADHYPKMFSTIFRENKIKTLEEALNCEEFWNINNGRTLCKPCHRLQTYSTN